MKWKKYTIHTTTAAEDIVSMMLMELGVEGVEIENNVPLSEADTKGMFIDILPELPEDDGSSRLSFYLHLDEESAGEASGRPDDGSRKAGVPDKGSVSDASYTIADRLWTQTGIEGLLKDIRAGLKDISAYTDIGEGSIEEGDTEDTDWRDNWKQFFKPIRTGGFLIKPSWEELPEDMEEEAGAGNIKILEIDPGTAFGTGSHETTQLCLGAIEKYIKGGEAVLDIGTGSGILGIAALKQGAGMAVATELDEQCGPSVRDNLKSNDIGTDQFRLFMGDLLGDGKTKELVMEALDKYHGKASGTVPERPGYDIIIANILAPVICALAGKGAADSLIAKDGIFIASGIIDSKAEETEAAFRANSAWKLLEINARGEWRSIVVQRV